MVSDKVAEAQGLGEADARSDVDPFPLCVAMVTDACAEKTNVGNVVRDPAPATADNVMLRDDTSENDARCVPSMEFKGV